MNPFKDKLVTDFDLQAFVDGELGVEEAKRIRKYIQNDKAAARRYNELLSQRELLGQWHNKQGRSSSGQSHHS